MSCDEWATLRISFRGEDLTIARYHVSNCVAAKKASTPTALKEHNQKAGFRLQLEIEKALGRFFEEPSVAPAKEQKTKPSTVSALTVRRKEKSSTARTARWRENNREQAREYQRNYMKEWRARPTE